jgi:3-hydroxybutyryl-CoA dehydratase
MTLPEFQTWHFEDLAVGQSESYTKEVKSTDVIGFAEISGDRNPIHLSEHFAAKVEVVELIAKGCRVRLHCTCMVGDQLVLEGEAFVKVPSRPR